jgi:hypothetical protein
MNRRLSIYVVILLCSFSLCVSSQSHKIDSIRNLLQNEKQDTTKLLLTIKLCIECNYIGIYDKALDYGNQAIALANALE